MDRIATFSRLKRRIAGTFRNVEWPGGASLLLAPAVVFAGVLVGCDNHSSPTAPAPVAPVAQVPYALSSVSYYILVTPYNEARAYPESAEISVDGEVVWSGAVPKPEPYFYYGYEYVPANVVAEVPGNLTAGAHTLSFRVTNQRRSPTGYYITAWAHAFWTRPSGNASSQIARWEDELVRLRNGEAWSAEFVVPTGP